MGGVHGDGIPLLSGTLSGMCRAETATTVSGSFKFTPGSAISVSATTTQPHRLGTLALNSASQIAVANKVQVRSWGALACVYLGVPK